MKPGLAILPVDVWADVFVFPWITRKKLSQIVDKFKEREFAEKLQTFLHDPKCGKHSLHHLRITYKPIDKPKKNQFKFQLRKSEIPKFQASLVVANGYYFEGKQCEFPQSEMPENIKAFKQLTIGYLDDQVLDFLDKIKPLFTNMIINMGLVEREKNLCTLFGHLLPMLGNGSIRQINCSPYYLERLERHVPGILARAKELDFWLFDKQASIPTCLSWLSAPLDFDVHGPRLLRMDAPPNVIIAMIDAVRKKFLVATAPSTFVILIGGHCHSQQHPEHRAEEFNLENAVTKEGLTVRNAVYEKPNGPQHCVEIMRHPTGVEAKMQNWLKERIYSKKKDNGDDGEKQVITIDNWPPLMIGQITKKAGAIDQSDEGKSDGNAAGPSTSSTKKKTCIIS